MALGTRRKRNYYFRLGNVICVVFNDDFVLGGPTDETNAAYEDLHSPFGLSDDACKDGSLKTVAGVQFKKLEQSSQGSRALVSQTDYVRYICKKYQKQQGVTLKPVSTPGKAKHDKADHEKMKLKGRMYNVAPEHVGKLFWVAGGSRPDI